MAGLFETLERIREKPESARRRILVGSTLIIMALIFILWINISFLAPKETKKAEVADIGPAPLDVIGETLKAGKDQLKNLIFKNETYTNQ